MFLFTYFFTCFVNRYSPKRIAVAELNRESFRTYVLKRIWVLLGKMGHFQGIRREVPCVIDIIIREAPWENSFERREVD